MENNKTSEDDVIDFSDYLKTEDSKKFTPPSAFDKPSAIQEGYTSPKKHFKLRSKSLLLILVILMAVQVVLLVMDQSSKKIPETPQGYRLVSPPNQPAYLEPIK
jgi:hypothetical protein